MPENNYHTDTKTQTETVSNGNLEQKVEHIMITKTKFYVGIIIFMVPVIGFFFKIQMDVALIKENHYVHIEQINRDIEDLKKTDSELRQQNVDLMKVLGDYNSKLDVLIGQHQK